MTASYDDADPGIVHREIEEMLEDKILAPFVKRGLTREEAKIELLKSLLKSEGTE